MRLAPPVFLARSMRVLTVVLPLLAATAGGSATASPIFKGDGVEASVYSMYMHTFQTNGVPAQDYNSVTMSYDQRVAVPYWNVTIVPTSIQATESAYAAATPSSSQPYLLELRASTQTPDTGQIVGAWGNGPDVDLSAKWANVAATVHAPDAAATPDAIRVDLDLAYTPPASLQTNSWDWTHPQVLEINNQAFPLGSDWTALTNYNGYGDGPAKLGGDGLLHQELHLDLPLDATGTSPLFSLALTGHLPGFVPGAALNDHIETSLSLKGVTLPDGVGLETAGYTISFESGLPVPVIPAPPVPEPTTWLAWTLLIGAGASVVRRRRPA